VLQDQQLSPVAACVSPTHLAEKSQTAPKLTKEARAIKDEKELKEEEAVSVRDHAAGANRRHRQF
jgi:hypothetical protein